jgi:hypothetical protein
MLDFVFFIDLFIYMIINDQSHIFNLKEIYYILGLLWVPRAREL